MTNDKSYDHASAKNQTCQLHNKMTRYAIGTQLRPGSPLGAVISDTTGESGRTRATLIGGTSAFRSVARDGSGRDGATGRMHAQDHRRHPAAAAIRTPRPCTADAASSVRHIH